MTKPTCRAKPQSHPSASLLTIKNVAERLQMSQRTVHRLIAEGNLTVIRIGRSVRITEDAFGVLLTPRDKS